MKKLELVQLNLKNFKGIKAFTLDANGESKDVFGDNEVGKTTLPDAFNWLFFDKDSNNKKDFAIKTLDEDNNEIHGLDHEVSATINVDRKPTIFQKIYKEKWTKKKGSAHKEFTGHTTDYFIDEVPVKLKEYKDKVGEILDEESFKLLTNPAYFNESLKWGERREILLEVCGDVSNEDVIASDRKLSKLSDILGDKSIDDLKKIIAGKKKEINKQLDILPARIDEVQHNLPDISGLSEHGLKEEAAEYQEKIQAKEDEISRIRNGSEVAEKQKQLSELETELNTIKNSHDSDNREKIVAKDQEYYKIKNLRDDIEFQITSADRKIKMNANTANGLEKQKKELADQYYQEKEKEMPEHDDSECSACGQALPVEQVKEAHEKALASFNRKKSERMEHIMSQGKQLKEKIAFYDDENEKILTTIEESKQSVENYDKQLEALQQEINDIKTNTTSIDENPKYKELQSDILNVKSSINELQSSTIGNTNQAKEELQTLTEEKTAVTLNLNKFEQHKQSKTRIKELTDQERSLSKEYEKLEAELYLSEEFIRTKVSLLEEKINSKFKYARFKLFETQINDGLKETCETLYKGVPYSKGLNNAWRINIGLDIINTLSEHYNFSAPIFIDNREAVTKLIDTEAQTISLIVSEKDKQLRVETSKEMELV
ncbi:AAA family ATPase [Salipaludibacillus sp. CF4.18]|uniref:ATP-binding protein n=1 Tax=Salipaludibacillus sp. CF4.18 TaxID=3373081 RepID=UPI003EE486D8